MLSSAIHRGLKASPRQVSRVMRAEIVQYFPYSSFRPYQDRFALKAYEAFAARKHAILEGVNGLGKTSAILAAALPIAKEMDLSILYTSRTHRQCDRAIEELQRISEKTRATGLSFRGRKEMCINKLVLQNVEDPRSAMELCNHLTRTHRCRFYERVEMNPKALQKLLRKFSSGAYTSAEIKDECSKIEFCPYEVAKRALDAVDVVALSYYYVLEPSIRSNFFRYFRRGLRRSILVLDECVSPDTIIQISGGRGEIEDIVEGAIEEAEGEHRVLKRRNAILCEPRREIRTTSIDPLDLKAREKRVIRLWRLRAPRTLYSIELPRVTILATGSTKLLVKRGDLPMWSEVKGIGAGTVVATEYVGFKWEKILEKKRVRPGRWVYDLTVEDTHSYLADSVWVHNSHNIPEISKEIASESLTSQTLRLAEFEAQRQRQRMPGRICSKMAEVLHEMAGEISEEEERINPKEFLSIMKRELNAQELATVAQKLIDVGEDNAKRRLAEGKNPRSYIQRVGGFLNKWLVTSDSETFAHILSFRDRESKKNPMLEIVSLDPRDTTNEVISSAYATLSTSGTLEPLESYRNVMGIPADAIMESFPAPYKPDQIACVAVLGTTTKLSARNPEMYEKLARRIGTASRSAPENIGVFAASYDVLEGLSEAGIEGLVGKPLYWERSGSTAEENDELLAEFKQRAGRGGGILMAVAGGRSSEGADFPGKEMTTSLVVGVPYPRPTVTVRAEIDFMERLYPGRGKLYGYVLPAIRKAAQSAGRAVRSLTDHSAIVFLDSRFATDYCRRFLPRWIRDNLSVIPDDDALLARRLEAFFKTNSDK